MAVYKVPQDVEAESKLVGPFTFRQFVFVLLLCGFLYVAWVLIKISIFLVIFPLPFIILLGALAFPWRKDQPTEVYLTAIIHFWLKPRKRIWNQEGHVEHVKITAPKTQNKVLTDGMDTTEVQSRLKALARKMDNIHQPQMAQPQTATAGGVGMTIPVPTQGSDRLIAPAPLPSNPTVVAPEPSDDVLDSTSNPVAQSFDQMVNKTTEERKAQLLQQVQQAAQQPVDSDSNDMPTIGYNPYPDMQQSVVAPGSSTPPPQAPPLPQPPTSQQAQGAIINLANNSDLNVSTIARQADQAMQSGDTIELH